MDTAIIVALCLSIVGNIINAWGMIWMKIGHELANAKRMTRAMQKYMDIREKELSAPESPDRSSTRSAEATKQTQKSGSAELSAVFLKEGKWWCGMATYGLGSLMHVASLGFGPSALLNPMEGLTLVANTLSSPPMLGETLTKFDIWGTVVIIAGTLLVIWFGPHTSEKYTADEIMDRFGRTPFIVWSGCIWSATGVGWGISKYVEHINLRDGIQMDGSLQPRGAIFLALMYTTTKGVMGGYTMLFGKMFAEVSAESGEGDNQFAKWETYLFFVLFVLFNFLMEYWRQKALNLFSTMYCVPLFQVSLVIFSVFTGAIFFSEFDGLATLNLIMFFLGVIVICIGVVILSVVTESRKLKQVPPRTRLKAAFLAVFAVTCLKNRKLKSPGSPSSRSRPVESKALSDDRKFEDQIRISAVNTKIEFNPMMTPLQQTRISNKQGSPEASSTNKDIEMVAFEIVV